jgi:BRCA1 C Terminus (BRCT) domain
MYRLKALEGLVVCVDGDKSIEDTVTIQGGKVCRKVNGATTHFVTGHSKSAAALSAKARGVDVVSLEWIRDVVERYTKAYGLAVDADVTSDKALVSKSGQRECVDLTTDLEIIKTVEPEVKSNMARPIEPQVEEVTLFKEADVKFAEMDADYDYPELIFEDYVFTIDSFPAEEVSKNNSGPHTPKHYSRERRATNETC